MSKSSSGCPICNKPIESRYRPFCSRRCADADLGRWFSGAYLAPGEPAPPEALPRGTRGETDADR